jgi:hypothetical protein
MYGGDLYGGDLHQGRGRPSNRAYVAEFKAPVLARIKNFSGYRLLVFPHGMVGKCICGLCCQ